jgi:hypothetical protein
LLAVRDSFRLMSIARTVRHVQEPPLGRTAARIGKSGHTAYGRRGGDGCVVSRAAERSRRSADKCRALQILYELTKSYSERGVGLHFVHLRPAHVTMFQFVGITNIVSCSEALAIWRAGPKLMQAVRAKPFPQGSTRGDEGDRELGVWVQCDLAVRLICSPFSGY